MGVFLQTVLWAATIVAGLLLLLLLGLHGYRTYLKHATGIRTPNGISSLEQITLGGMKQWIFLRGADQKNPVLIFLHGGPGEPAAGMPSSRMVDEGLLEHVTVVHWDQRGAGKSYREDIPVASMALDRLVEDCNELMDHLRTRFDTPRVFLVAHSAGTTIGIRTAHRYPQKIHAYVGVSQIVNDFEQQRISYDFAVEQADRSGDATAQRAVASIGPPPYETPTKVFEKARYIVRYGGFVHANAIRHMSAVMVSYLTSPEYSLREGIRTMSRKGLDFTMAARWEDIKSVDFKTEIRSIRVPIYLFVGRHVMITPTVQIEDFYRGLDAEKGKQLIVFEHSAHLPLLEEREKYQDALVDIVLKESRND